MHAGNAGVGVVALVPAVAVLVVWAAEAFCREPWYHVAYAECRLNGRVIRAAKACVPRPGLGGGDRQERHGPGSIPAVPGRPPSPGAAGHIGSSVAGSDDGPKLTAIVAVSHWQPMESAQRQRRTAVLQRVLETFSTYPVSTHVILVTNAKVDQVDGLVAEQVIRPEPTCSHEMIKHDYCMPWETIKAMRSAAGGAGCNLADEAVCGDLRFDYYIYTEDDVEIPAATFQFWQKHVDSIFRRNLLLMPYRREAGEGGTMLLSDCFLGEACLESGALWDEEGVAELYEDSHHRFYLQPVNPGSGAWMLNREQFTDYLNSGMWSFLSVNSSRKWTHPREYAFASPWISKLGNPRGEVLNIPLHLNKVLTHLQMPVIHLAPATLHPYRCLASLHVFETLIEDCAEGRTACGSF